MQGIKLEPAEPNHRLTAARVLWRQQEYDEAVKQAQMAAAALARTEDDRRQGTEMNARIEEAKRQAGKTRLSLPAQASG